MLPNYYENHNIEIWRIKEPFLRDILPASQLLSHNDIFPICFRFHDNLELFLDSDDAVLTKEAFLELVNGDYFIKKKYFYFAHFQTSLNKVTDLFFKKVFINLNWTFFSENFGFLSHLRIWFQLRAKKANFFSASGYLARFTDELEQIEIKNSIGNTKNRRLQHASRQVLAIQVRSPH